MVQRFRRSAVHRHGLLTMTVLLALGLLGCSGGGPTAITPSLPQAPAPEAPISEPANEGEPSADELFPIESPIRNGAVNLAGVSAPATEMETTHSYMTSIPAHKFAVVALRAITESGAINTPLVCLRRGGEDLTQAQVPADGQIHFVQTMIEEEGELELFLTNQASHETEPYSESISWEYSLGVSSNRVDPQEPNNALGEATVVPFDLIVIGQLHDGASATTVDYVDYFRYVADSEHRIDLELIPQAEVAPNWNIAATVFDPSGSVLGDFTPMDNGNLSFTWYATGNQTQSLVVKVAGNPQHTSMQYQSLEYSLLGVTTPFEELLEPTVLQILPGDEFSGMVTSTVTLSTAIAGPWTSIDWNIGSGATPATASGPVAEFTLTAVGTHTAELIVESPSGNVITKEISFEVAPLQPVFSKHTINNDAWAAGVVNDLPVYISSSGGCPSYIRGTAFDPPTLRPTISSAPRMRSMSLVSVSNRGAESRPSCTCAPGGAMHRCTSCIQPFSSPPRCISGSAIRSWMKPSQGFPAPGRARTFRQI